MMKRTILVLMTVCGMVTFAASDTGVRVNHLVLGPTTSAGGSSPWSYSKNVLKLTGQSGSDYILSGKNLTGDVTVEVQCDCTITLEDFELDVSSRAGWNAFAITGNHAVTLNLVGRSSLQGAVRGCGILVMKGNELIIRSESGTGSLSACGGTCAAGIGGEYYKAGSGDIAILGGSCGSVSIYSGSVFAQGGVGGAGIGGGGNYSENPLAIGGAGGVVRIYGGTVTALGGTGAAGIGGGRGIGYATWDGNDSLEFKGGDGGTVDIYGGSVVVDGGSQAAAIGGGHNGHGGYVGIHGGTVRYLSTGTRDVGAGFWDRSAALAKPGDYRIYGGSVQPRTTTIRPKNEAGVDVFPVTIVWPTHFASPPVNYLKVDGKNYTYGMKESTTGDEGKYVLWLPAGEAQFAVDGEWHRAAVRSPAATAEKIETTFNGFGGRVVYNGKSDTQVKVAIYEPGQKYDSLPSGVDVTRSGYEFLGWYDSEGRRVVDSDIVPVESRTLTAKWSTPIDRGTAVGNSGLSFSAYRNRPELTTCTWFGQSEIGYSNGNSMRSGTIGNGQTNVLRGTVTGPGTISFRYKVSSEKNYDKLMFYSVIEPSEILLSASGTDDTSWRLFSCSIPAGKQTLVWTYAKDNSISKGEDCAYLDDIRFECQEEYVVRFAANGGTGAMSDLKYRPGKIYNLPKCSFTKSGRRFVGWLDSNGRRYDDGVLVFDLADVGATLTLTAVWE